jgi:hypothetical protein
MKIDLNIHLKKRKKERINEIKPVKLIEIHESRFRYPFKKKKRKRELTMQLVD